MDLNSIDTGALLAALQELQAPTGPEAMGDDDLALHALNSRFNGDITFSKALGWRYFPDGGPTWITDHNGDEVTGIVQTMLRDLRQSETDPRKSQYLASRQRRDNVVSMLRYLPELRYSGPWDSTEHLLAAPNGVIDLRTGELLEGAPDQRITRRVSVPYEPDALAPRWEKFVAEVFAHDPELPAYVQRLIGYGATGSNREQCFAVLYGEGSNGKSVFLTALREIMGEHAATVPFDMFTVSGKARGGPETEMLAGTRLALASETNRAAVLDSAAIKNATGGEEITVNPKFRDPYAFKPQALILLATNYKPIVKEQDNGTWRRIKLLPFLQRFEGDAKDMDLDAKLRAEYAGILAWIVRGAVAWYASGLPDIASVREAVADYKDESDTLAGFLPGKLELKPGAYMSNAEVWTAYQEWAEANGCRTFNSGATLNKALIERSRGEIRSKRTASERGLIGVALTADGGAAGVGIFANDS
ncbi:DNA primase family protein [Streptomyces gossypiisoli]|uniref:DNA primase family protein n=1 Tax=Streptomyces gossypiisoli TaxID=2748864 RepID=UPI0015DBB034|nr:phage/plasmid primase, P4 family [Streptomyces gossypiisoli]